MTIEPQTYSARPLFLEPGAQPNGARIMRKMGLRARGSFDLRRGKIMDAPCLTYGCKEPEGFAGTRYCRTCAMELWHMVQNATTDGERAAKLNDEYAEHLRFQAVVDQRMDEFNATKAAMNQPGHVYYLRVGDLIKIGFSADLARRIKEYPPNTVVLAAHPGTPRTERQMHERFSAHLARGREWFYPVDEITDHIAQVLAEYPLAEVQCMHTGYPLNLSA